MSATTLTLTVDLGVLDMRSPSPSFDLLAVQMSREVPLRTLEATLDDAQERLIDPVCGARWALVRGRAAPFACPRCGERTSPARAADGASCTLRPMVELMLWNVGCRDCERVFVPLLEMLGFSASGAPTGSRWT